MRHYIYTDSWGLHFQEFCLPLNYIKDQMKLSRLREDLIEGKIAIDEIMPYVMGIPQHVENEQTDVWDENGYQGSTSSSAYVTTLHDNCMNIRSQWYKWYYGDLPDITIAIQMNTITKQEEQSMGMDVLRKLAYHKPTIEDIQSGKYLRSNNSDSSSSNSVEMEYNVDIQLSDIFQRYSESCYDTDCINVISKIIKTSLSCSSSIDDILTVICMNSIMTIQQGNSSYSDYDNMYDEIQIRELLYRCMKVYGSSSSYNNNIAMTVDSNKGSNSVLLSVSCNITLQQYDEFIHNYKTEISCHSHSKEDKQCDEDESIEIRRIHQRNKKVIMSEVRSILLKHVTVV